MIKILTKLQQNLVYAIPVSMLIGLIGGGFLFDAKPLKQFIIPITFLMIYPMMTTLNVKTIFKGRDTKLQVTTQLINFILIPIIVFALGKIFFSGLDPKYGLWAVALFLIGVLPASGMTISWTGFAKGNKEAATKMLIFGLIIGSMAAPVYTKVFMGATVDVDMVHMFQQICIFVFIPLIAGLTTQTYLRKKHGQQAWMNVYKPKFPPFSALGVIMIAFVAMSLKAKNIIANPADLVTILIPLTVFYLISYLVLSFIGKIMFKREDAIAMVYGVVMRDLSIALAIAMTAFGKEGSTIALLIAMAYVIQIQSAAWYVKLTNKIFGPPAKTIDSSQADISPVHVQPDESGKETLVVEEIKKILFASDISSTAKFASRYACGIGNKYDAQVWVIHVIPDVLDTYSSEAGYDISAHVDANQKNEFNKEAIETAQHLVQKRIREESKKVLEHFPHCPLSEERVIIKAGDPVEKIVTEAETGGFDLVIMGTHGHRDIKDLFVGSTASGVIQTSKVPVLVARPS
ncbi:MAG: universal stress protein [Desulfobacter sp.]|nr:universal stress protein [Desulfobacter sp.]WDP85267.1 MAG: universal stress protein [Desulfobacter sp.]